MKFKLTEDQINYNANPQNRNEGDCTIRALSLAYDMNYNTVKGELNSIASKTKGKFNYITTVKEFIEHHGYLDFFDNENMNSNIDDVDDFARRNKHGVYVVYCSNKTKQENSNSFHMVAVIDGDIYDTWDPSNYYVLGAWKIKNHNRTVNQIKEEFYKIDETDIEKLANSLYNKFMNMFSHDGFKEQYVLIKSVPTHQMITFEFQDYPELADLLHDKLKENYKNIQDIYYNDFDSQKAGVNYNELFNGIEDVCYSYAKDFLGGKIDINIKDDKLDEDYQPISTTKENVELLKPKEDIIENNKILFKKGKYYFIKDFAIRPGKGLCAYTVEKPDYYIPMKDIENYYDLFKMEDIK